MAPIPACQFILAEILLIFVFRSCYGRVGLLQERVRCDLAPWHDHWEIRACRAKIFVIELAMIAMAIIFFGLALYQALTWILR